MTPQKPVKRGKVCEWDTSSEFKYICNYWYTSCKAVFKPHDNCWKYIPFAICPYCGKRIRRVKR